jgi:prepilin-type N-terminal cleavage/methylation domain-containing protein
MGFTLTEMLVVIAIIGTLVGLLMPAVQSARESARRTACGNNFKQVGIALTAFEATRERYPPSSRSLGWCVPSTGFAKDAVIYNLNGLVLLLPFLDQAALFDRYNSQAASGMSFSATSPVEATNLPPGGRPTATNPSGGSNAALSGRTIPTLLCPSDPGDVLMSSSSDVRWTADPTANPPVRAAKTNYDFSVNPTDRCNDWLGTTGTARFMFGENSATTPALVRDGLSNTIAMAEVTLTYADPIDQGNPWAFRASRMVGASPATQGVNRWQTISGTPAARVGRLGRWGWAGGNHRGGCYVLLGDGALRFVIDRNDTDFIDLLDDLSRISDGGNMTDRLP